VSFSLTDTEPPRLSGGWLAWFPRRHRGGLKLGVVGGFSLGGRNVADRFEQATGAKPVDPFEGRKLDGLEGPPWTAPMDHLGLVEAIDRLGERVVIGVADAADRRFDARRDEPLGVAQRDVLRTSVALMHETAPLDGATLVQGLLQSVEHEAGMGGSGNAPSDDAPSEDIDDEGHVDEAALRGTGHCGADLSAPHDAPQPHDAHQPRHGAAGNVDALAAELPPTLRTP